MANVFIKARPKGREEGTRIDDYVVEEHTDHLLGSFKTQHEALEWAKKQGHAPLVAGYGTSMTGKNPIIGDRHHKSQSGC